AGEVRGAGGGAGGGGGRRRGAGRERRRRGGGQRAGAAPVAAAAAMVLVIGLAVAVAHGLFGPRQPGGRDRLPAAPLPFYVTTDLSIPKIVVPSTATGRGRATLPGPPGRNTRAPVAPPLA